MRPTADGTRPTAAVNGTRPTAAVNGE